MANELDFGTGIALIKGLGGKPTDEQVTTAVDAWLDAHPEATTTVEDGSISYAKLNSSLKGTVDDVGDLKTAIDDLSTATSLDVGKALSPKTVANGKVTEWQYKVIGGGGGGGAVEDVQINGTSVVDGEGVANITPSALDIVQAITGTTPSITALPGIRYVCGEVATLAITLPASGIIDVVFESGSTPTVLTVTPPTGVTAVKWANGFDPTSLDANTTYEINVMDGEFGVVGAWT